MSSNIIMMIIVIGGVLGGIALFKILIPMLYRLKFGQSIRKEGPTSHLKKSGTPTMGGIGIIIITCIVFTFLIRYALPKLTGTENPLINLDLFLLLVTPFVGYGIIGFIDDYLIVCMKSNRGLSSSIKFILQLLLAILVYIGLMESDYLSEINFFGTNTNIGFFYGLFILFILVATTNATNLTDGLDGLLGINMTVSMGGVALYAFIKEEYLIMFFALSLIIANIAFLYFNLPKAKLFMGDTGSLAMGAGLVMCLILLEAEILLIFFGFVYFVETISVMLQVWYFKRTKGKRIIKMSPLHHHLELCNLSESEIDIIFAIINIIFTLLGVYLGVRLF